MRNLKVISMMLVILMLIPACQVKDDATESQHFASTAASLSEIEPSSEATIPSEEATTLTTATEPSSEATEPSSDNPTEPDEPDPEPREPVTVVGTYDSVEEVFADYEKRYVTYGKGENNYDTVCKGLQKDNSVEDQYIAFIFTDIDDFGFLVHHPSGVAILLKQVFAFNTLYSIDGFYDDRDGIGLYRIYDIYEGNIVSVGTNVVAFACERNVVPLLFYEGGYLSPKKDGQYNNQLFYFTEENGEIKYDWEPHSFADMIGYGMSSWLEMVINEGITGDYIVRHSGTVILENGKLHLREEKTMALNDWLWICPDKDHVMNCYGGLKNMTFDEIVQLYQERGWYGLREYSDSLKEQEGK